MVDVKNPKVAISKECCYFPVKLLGIIWKRNKCKENYKKHGNLEH